MRQKTTAISQAEQQVVDQLLAGSANREIAVALNRSVGTVKNQLRSVYLKYGVKSRTQLLLRLLSPRTHPGGNNPRPRVERRTS
jgi:DNA-binding CsgD family transcriptional regulator